MTITNDREDPHRFFDDGDQARIEANIARKVMDRALEKGRLDIAQDILPYYQEQEEKSRVATRERLTR